VAQRQTGAVKEHLSKLAPLMELAESIITTQSVKLKDKLG
jgi:hypothetical protein